MILIVLFRIQHCEYKPFGWNIGNVGEFFIVVDGNLRKIQFFSLISTAFLCAVNSSFSAKTVMVFANFSNPFLLIS